jgi:hypothetical protein
MNASVGTRAGVHLCAVSLGCPLLSPFGGHLRTDQQAADLQRSFQILRPSSESSDASGLHGLAVSPRTCVWECVPSVHMCARGSVYVRVLMSRWSCASSPDSRSFHSLPLEPARTNSPRVCALSPTTSTGTAMHTLPPPTTASAAVAACSAQSVRSHDREHRTGWCPSSELCVLCVWV